MYFCGTFEKNWASLEIMPFSRFDSESIFEKASVESLDLLSIFLQDLLRVNWLVRSD
jgi:hypothetical protein